MTKKMPALFAKHPPKKPLTSLDAIVDDWIYRFGKKGVSKQMRDEVVDYCAAAKSFKEAVARACLSKRPNGKLHNHQSRVPEKVRMQFAKNILHVSPNPDNFDALYDELDRCKPYGIGPVTLYDVATRIAAYLKLEVESLYLHAGVMIGWCVLHGQRVRGYELRIPRGDIPKALRRLPTDEIEDFLCAYRELLKPWLKA